MSIETLRQKLGGDERVLALEPEELAGHLMVDLNQTADRDERDLNKQNYLMAMLDPKCPVKRAIAEAWSYLEREGLMADMGGSGYFPFVTRRGRKIRTPEAVAEIEKARFPRHLLHPSIVQRSWPPFIRGEYETAVFMAFKEVEIRVRQAAGLSADEHGVALMRKAFHATDGPLTDKSAPVAEREALGHLFSGAIGYFRNPPGHRDAGYNDPAEAIEMIALASHLVRLVERSARSAPASV